MTQDENYHTDQMTITYEQTGRSTNTDAQGMREMQARVYERRNEQYLLVKAPPASGKSRAMMFVALDKLAHQGIRKVIVAVPEKSIGRSFRPTELKRHGFFEDWDVSPYFDLCDVENEKDKVKRFKEFVLPDTKARTLVCTHATLRFALKELRDEQLSDLCFGIDEFHHTSADADNGLGELVRRLMNRTNAHILAMTGSYFRGDGTPVLRQEEQVRFTPVQFTYYDQLNGYRYLQSLGLGYHFYRGHYLSALHKVLDTRLKTLIHIPVTNSKAAGAYDKFEQVKQIIDLIGSRVDEDYNTRIITVKTKDGRLLKVADLVEPEAEHRRRVQGYLQRMKRREDVDIIIAMGMAKEGFDWEWCEHCLTIGVRGSLTEIVQIIGRCTRDSEGKPHAQFTNLIAAPDETQDDVVVAVNDMLKAITASLLMEQVMAPRWNFKTSIDEEDDASVDPRRRIVVEGLKPLGTARARQIVEEDLDELTAGVLQHPLMHEAIEGVAPEMINKVYIPKIVEELHPELEEEEVEPVSQRVVLNLTLKGKDVVEDMENHEGCRFVKVANTFINIYDLNINLIEAVNPFQRAYEIMSNEIDAPVLKVIQDAIEDKKINMDIDEAKRIYLNVFREWHKEHGELPTLKDPDPTVRRMAEAIRILKNYKIRYELGLDMPERKPAKR
ncbi:MAG: DEAD/DEAH box helicase family protein [Bacteroidaceae bacterium]|nr:DEAD/DEAH box helicase family protein [Bacteroidaceae bacterium]